MADEQAPPQPGEMLAHYEVLERLAIGGMGEIYAARDTRLERLVALKVLTDEAVAGAGRLQRFEVEARAVAAMNHPNIVTIHGVEFDHGVHFLAMELVEGRTLGKVIPPGGLPIREFFRLAEQLTEAVAVAHQSGITHRDLKPDNVMVSSDGHVKVLDFGLAKLVDESPMTAADDASTSPALRPPSPRLTADGHLLGTVPYMSPEHVTRRGIDHRSDIFSLGIILYEMLTGQRPFQGATPGTVMSSIRHDTAEPLTRLRPDVPRSIEIALDLCLEKDPAVRMQQASALHEQLRIARREISSSPGGAGQADVPPAPASQPASMGGMAQVAGLARRHRWSLMLLVAVLVVNYLETSFETTLRSRYDVGVELGFELARAAYWFEGPTTLAGHGPMWDLVVYGFSFAYFFALLLLVLATGWALARTPGRRPFQQFALAIAVNYVIALPFFLFFPVPERWAYPDSGATLLSDLWAPRLIEWFRPFSGLDNCFPSFHVSLTVVMVTLAFLYRLRFRWSALWIGLLIILSTSVLGIHWLTDIAAGLAAGTIAVVTARRILPRHRPPLGRLGERLRLHDTVARHRGVHAPPRSAPLRKMLVGSARRPVTHRTRRTLVPLAILGAFVLVVVGMASPILSAPTTGRSENLSRMLLYAGVALVFSFLCSVAEAVLLSISPGFLATRIQTGSRSALLLEKVKRNIDRSLAGILTLNTIAHTVGAGGAGAEASFYFGDQYVGLAMAVLTLLILFLSEIVPKTIGAVYWRRLAYPTAWFTQILTWALYPLIWVSEKLTRLITGGKPIHSLRREEIAAMAEIGEDYGQLDAREGRILRNLFRFDDLRVKDIMTPRTVVFTLPQDLSVSEVVKRHPDPPFSRIPIHGETRDDITGFVLKTDLLLAELQGRGGSPIESLRRAVRAVNEDASLVTTTDTMLDERLHLLVVFDEYGGLAGVVTLEDVVETLIGIEIVDEADKIDDMRKHARRKWQARMEKLGIDLEALDEDEPSDAADEDTPPRDD